MATHNDSLRERVIKRASGGAQPKFTRGQLDGIASAYAAGARAVDIAARYECSLPLVYTIIRAYKEGNEGSLPVRGA